MNEVDEDFLSAPPAASSGNRRYVVLEPKSHLLSAGRRNGREPCSDWAAAWCGVSLGADQDQGGCGATAAPESPDVGKKRWESSGGGLGSRSSSHLHGCWFGSC
jgi:hypothetical protein